MYQMRIAYVAPLRLTFLLFFCCFQLLPNSAFAMKRCEAFFKRTKKELFNESFFQALSQKSPALATVFSRVRLFENDPLVQKVGSTVAQGESFFEENLLGLNIDLDISVQEKEGFLIVAVPWIRTGIENESRSQGLNRNFYKIVAGLLLGSSQRFSQKSNLHTLILVGNNVVNTMLLSQLPQKGFQSDGGLLYQLNLEIRKH